MKLDEYQANARKTAIYPGELMYPTLGLAGEVAEMIWASEDAIEKEVGDVMWYVASVAHDAGLKLSEVNGTNDFTFPDTYSYVQEAFDDLVIYAGEVCEAVKKTFRDSAGEVTPYYRERIAKSLEGVLCALHAVGDYYGFTLEECAKKNNEKLASRMERGVISGDGDDR
jgi:NTP pyrophosphatase (non-canonical NTP hydrolase)